MLTGREEALNRVMERIRRECKGPVLDALEDPDIAEVMRNPDGKVWVWSLTRGIVDTGYVMPQSQSRSMLETTASLLGTTLTEDNPILEGEFPLDGSRLEGLIYPVVASDTFSVRKASVKIFSLESYRDSGVLPAGKLRGPQHQLRSVDSWPSAYDCIRAAIGGYKNILVVGGTGSGKTTFINACFASLHEQCPNDRLIVIEDTREVQVTMPNRVLMRSSERVPMDRLLKASLRLNPTRIAVGEVRSGEAFTLMKAWSTGHPGGMCTVHSDSASEGLDIFLTRCFEHEKAGNLTQEMMGRMIASTVDYVVVIEKTGGGTGRLITELAEVLGYEHGKFVVKPVDIAEAGDEMQAA